MKHRTLTRAVAAVGIASLALTACSSSSDSGEETAAGEETTTTEESAEVVSTDCEPAQATPGAAPVTTPLKIGTLLPETGTLAFLGPPEVAGVQVAINEVNEAGGVLDQPVRHHP